MARRHRSSERRMDRAIADRSAWLEESPPISHRDRDGAYGEAFVRRVWAMGIQDRPTAARSPWQNGKTVKLSNNSDTTKAINYIIKRWDAFTRFVDDRRLCMSNNAAECELRAVALGRRNWTFAGSDEGGRRAAAIYTLIATAKLNNIDPQQWLADVLARLADHPARRINELLPWNWHRHDAAARAA